MKRWDIINELIKQNGYSRYLEIGYGDGQTFKNVDCNYKIGVDPNPHSKCDHITTSDEFFSKNN